jgi:mannose-6-phosphate isomerase-like protein (cupin superfamily)
MARAGEWFQNTRTKELALLTVSPSDTGGTRLEAELWLEPGAAVMGEHVHDRLAERFTVLEGELAVVLDGAQSIAGPGGVVEIAPGRAHDWSNAGATVAHVRVEVEGPAPTAMRFVEMIEAGFGLANAGHTDEGGRPTPLWLAAMATEYRDVLRLTSPPALVQRLVLGPLALVARLAGRDVRAAWLHGDGSPSRAPAPEDAAQALAV